VSALRLPPGRRASRWPDHALAGLGSLLAAAALGALLVTGADLAERVFGLTTAQGGLLAVIWVFGIGLMAAPKTAWILLPPGAALLIGARRLGLGGWAVAAGIGAGLAALAGLGLPGSAADTAIRLAIGATIGLAYWKVLDFRCARPDGASFTHR
jgi:hypothetical protein